MFKKIQGLINSFSKLTYAKASVYYVAANIIGQGIVLLSSAVFTRMMDKTDYGLVSTYSTWVLVINTFICLNLFITVRNAYIDFREDYDRFCSSVLYLSLISGIAISIILALAVGLFVKSISVTEVIYACIQSVALNIINYEMAIQSMQNKYIKRSLLMILPNWTHTVLSIVLILIFTQNKYIAKIAGNSIGLAIFGIICLIAIFKRHRPCIDKKYWRYSLKISVPSVFNTLSDLILMQSDRIMLTSLVGAQETAEYTVVYNVSSIIVAIYQAINGAWTPWFFKKAAEDNKKDTKKAHFYYMCAFTFLSCIIMAVSPELIKIISPSNYWDSIGYVAPIVFASYLIFLYAFFSVYLMYMKYTGRIARNTIIAAVINLLLNYFLIPQYKAKGAVIATAVSYLVLFLLHYISIGKEGRKFFSHKGIILNTLIIIVFGVFFSFVKDYSFIIRYAVVIIASAVILIAYRKKIFEILKLNN